MKEQYGNSIFVHGIFYQELTEDEIEQLYIQGANVFHSYEKFLKTLYEGKTISQNLQDRIDAKLRSVLEENKKYPQDYFPDSVIND